jgi:hypothetical protein
MSIWWVVALLASTAYPTAFALSKTWYGLSASKILWLIAVVAIAVPLLAYGAVFLVSTPFNASAGARHGPGHDLSRVAAEIVRTDAGEHALRAARPQSGDEVQYQGHQTGIRPGQITIRSTDAVPGSGARNFRGRRKPMTNQRPGSVLLYD